MIIYPVGVFVNTYFAAGRRGVAGGLSASRARGCRPGKRAPERKCRKGAAPPGEGLSQNVKARRKNTEMIDLLCDL